MIKNPTLKRDTSIARRATHTMKSLFVEDVTKALVHQSFYLPADVRDSEDYRFYKPFVLSNKEFNEWIVNGPRFGDIVFDGSEWLIRKARWIVVTCRKDIKAGVQWYVCKVWYGEKP